MKSGRIKLKKITLSGFKSFADKTSIQFDEGINAIVGPNGCGKSNIADAFRWVLGEQSAKSLRGGKMEDVLFSGTEKKRAQNMAEVTLTFENDGVPLSVPYKEIEITRRYYRGGEGEYLIAQNPVRLKDVQALMMELSLGKNPYVIFEQGKIDQIVLMSPEERRSLFEEAAGIVCFLVSKKETLKKLEEARGHILRVQDLQKESDRQVLLLKKEADLALRYQALKDEIYLLEKDLLSTRIFEKRSLIHKYAIGKEDLQNRLKALQGELHQKKGNLACAQESIQNKRICLDKLRDQFSSLDKENSILETQKNHLIQNKQAIEKEIAALHESLSRGISDSSESVMRQKKLQEELLEIQQRIDSQKTEIELLKEGRKLADEALHAARKSLDEAQSQAMQSLKEASLVASKLEGERKRLETLFEMGSSRIKLIEERLSELFEKKEAICHLESVRKETGKTLFNEKEAFSAKEIAFKSDLQRLFAEEKSLTEAHQAIERTCAKEEATLIALQKELKGKEVDGRAFIRLQEKFPMLKPLYEVIEPASDPVLIFRLRRYEKTLLVPNREIETQILEWAALEKLSGFSLFCGDGQALVPRDAQDDASIWVDENGVLFSIGREAPSSFERHREIVELEEKVSESQKTKEALSLKKVQLTHERLALSAQLEEAAKQREIFEKKIVGHQFLLEKESGERARLEAEEKRLQEELQKVQADTQEAEEKLLKLGQAGLKTLGQEEKAAHDIDRLKAHLQEKIIQSGTRRRQQEEKESLFAELVKALEKKKHLLEMESLQERERAKSEIREKERLVFLNQEQACFKQQEQSMEARLLEITPRLKECDQKSTEEKKILENEERQCSQLEKEVNRLLREEKSQEQQMHAVELSLKEAEASEKILVSEFLDRFEQEIPNEATPLEQSEGLTEELIRSKKEELHAFPEINFAAKETLEKEATRALDLSAKIEDLSMAESRLLSFLAELENKSRALFDETFEQIRTAFQKNFATLFEGGEANLVKEGEDPLSCKIHILARPPGKKLQSITLLSGGERCLTAMALLFSIFEARISPFSILDEIDAPLDEANVDRLTHLLDRFSEKTQFIVITHNKRTMEKADRLLGVTMQEKGVSSLVTIQFEKQEVALI